jgi:hypothetical protein
MYLHLPKAESSGALREVEVLLEEIPPWLLEVALDPVRWALCQELLQAVVSGEPVPEGRWRECHHRLGAFVTIGMARMSQSLGANVAIGMARLSPSHGANVAVKNSNSGFKLLNSETNLQPGEESSQARGASPPPQQQAKRFGFQVPSEIKTVIFLSPF